MGVQVIRPDQRVFFVGNDAIEVYHGSGAVSYINRVLQTNPVAYWPLNETSGSIAYCQVNSAQNGTYTGVTLNDTTSPTGDPCPYFPGAACECDILTDTIKGSLSKAAGTMMIWIYREDPPGWNTGDTDYIFRFYFVNVSNIIDMSKPGSALFQRYRQGANEIVVEKIPGPSGWTCIAMTWDTTADEFKAYIDGAQYGSTRSGLVAPAGAMTNADVGAIWEGWLAHAALWDTALSAPTLLDLATV